MKMLNTSEPWKDFSDRLRHRFPKLTEDDVMCVEEREEDTLKRIQDRLGKSREQTIDMLFRIKLRD
jgi:hypothetical protein